MIFLVSLAALEYVLRPKPNEARNEASALKQAAVEREDGHETAAPPPADASADLRALGHNLDALGCGAQPECETEASDVRRR